MNAPIYIIIWGGGVHLEGGAPFPCEIGFYRYKIHFNPPFHGLPL